MTKNSKNSFILLLFIIYSNYFWAQVALKDPEPSLCFIAGGSSSFATEGSAPPQLGYEVGINIPIRLRNAWYAKFNVIYLEKGGFDRLNKAQATLSYINLAPIFFYRMRKLPAIGAGAYFGLGIPYKSTLLDAGIALKAEKPTLIRLKTTTIGAYIGLQYALLPPHQTVSGGLGYGYTTSEWNINKLYLSTGLIVQLL